MEFITGNTIDLGSLKLIHPDGSTQIIEEDATFDFAEPLNLEVDKLTLVEGTNAADWVVWKDNSSSKIYLIYQYAVGLQTFNLGGSVDRGSGILKDEGNNEFEFAYENPHYENIPTNVAKWPEFEVGSIKGKFVLLSEEQLKLIPVEVTDKIKKDDIMISKTLGEEEVLTVEFGSEYCRRKTLKCISWNASGWVDCETINKPTFIEDGETKYRYRPVIEVTGGTISFAGEDSHLGIKDDTFMIDFEVKEWGMPSLNGILVDIKLNGETIETMDVIANESCGYELHVSYIEKSIRNRNVIELVATSSNGTATRTLTFNKLRIPDGTVVSLGRAAVENTLFNTKVHYNLPISKETMPKLLDISSKFTFNEEYSADPVGEYKFEGATKKIYSWVAWNNNNDNELYLVGTTPMIRNLSMLADPSEGIVDVVNKIKNFDLDVNSLDTKFLIPNGDFFYERNFMPMTVWEKINTYGTYVVSTDNDNEINSTHCFMYPNSLESFSMKKASELNQEDISFLPVIKVVGMLPPVIVSDMSENLGEINKEFTIEYDVLKFNSAVVYINVSLNGKLVDTMSINNNEYSTKCAFTLTQQQIESLEKNSKNTIEIALTSGDTKVSKLFNFTKVNTAPTVTTSVNADLGVVTEGIQVTYKPFDADGDRLNIIESLNDKNINTFSTSDYTTRQISILASDIQKLDSRSTNTIKVTVNDGKDTAEFEWTFVRGDYPPQIIDNGVTDLGVLMNKPVIAYIPKDNDFDTLTVTERINGEIIRTFSSANGVSNTVFISDEAWEKCTRTENVVTVEVTNASNLKATKSYKFSKVSNRIDVETRKPIDIKNPAVRVKLNVEWSNYGGKLIVMVCNNAYDENPTWEDMTEYSLKNKIYTIENTQKTSALWGLKFKIIIDREDGYTGNVMLYGFNGSYEE